MYSRLYNFLTIHNCIYDLQFGFRKNHSVNHALTSLTEDIRRSALDDNCFASGVFIDLQKAFDTVDHGILLSKLNHYGIRGKANDWFKSYLTNRKQFVSINGFNSNELLIKIDVPQGSVLGPLLVLVYINDLHLAIKYSTTRLFADHTSLLIKNKSLKQLKKHLNIDLRNLTRWLKANKISLNASKTELLVFRHPNKIINYDLKLKIDGKRLYPSKYVKYLGILIDSHLNWCFHTDLLSTKLSRSIGMLSKIRHYVSKDTLRMIYFGIFSSQLVYASQIWAQTQNRHVNRIEKLQNNALRVINFAHFRDSSNALYYKTKVLKLNDCVKIQNFVYVLESIKGNLPIALNKSFELTKNIYEYNTRGSLQYNVSVPKARTQMYGIKSIKYQSVQFWNHIMKTFPDKQLQAHGKTVCKKYLTSHLLELYKS